MSPSKNPRSASRFPRVPDGDVVASYALYEDARAAVDRLVHSEGFAVQSVSIVGSDLRSIERVTGRMSYWRAAMSGAMSGLMLGLFFGAVMLLLDPASNLAMVLGIMLLGAVFGSIWGMIGYAISPDKREFTSMMQVTASRYDLIVAREHAGEVRRILGGAAGTLPPPAAPQARWYGAPDAAGRPGAPAAAPGAPGAVIPGADAGAPASTAAPVGPPRTYGEMQDELRRREREAAAGGPAPAPESRPAAEPPTTAAPSAPHVPPAPPAAPTAPTPPRDDRSPREG
ncbi:MAG: TIGR04086 family membrane protein [Microbacteriaceae bacterium]|nr:TIGR04086 family membrane protein [Microbacteriaceae bacterium]